MSALARIVPRRLRYPMTFLLLPLSALPLAAVVPVVMRAHATYVRYYKSPPYPAPGNVLSAAQRGQFTPLAAFTGQIPVLVYHGINDKRDGYSVSQRAFAAQMQMLRAAGFRSVSIDQYDRFQRGDQSSLPARPILITFDDGRLDSFRGADQVLAQEGFRATMFVITGQIERKNPFYLDWAELKRMQNSGRWDVQPHAYRGHVQIPVDSHGDRAPFYAMRRYLRSTGEETFADYQRRVALDLFTLAGQFKNQAIDVHAIALPAGDYGQQDAGNDPRIVPFTLGLMRAQFGTVFVQDDHDNPPYTTPTDGGLQKRWEAHSSTTPEQLYQWLSAHDPSTPTATGSTPSAPTYDNHNSER
ncbi:MAG: polysaccharide deacetylase family protein [Solirubrobacteraceae bacterium]